MNTERPRFPKPSPFQSGNARRMRHAMTDAEKNLWYALRHRIVLRSTHFRRQVSIDRFIVDFCCLGAKLIIEVDGGQHHTSEAEAKDAERTKTLNEQGFKVLRFSNRDVLTDMDSVVATVFATVQNTLSGEHSPTPTPYPSPQGGGESRASSLLCDNARVQHG